jgi:hypothetical protein
LKVTKPNKMHKAGASMFKLLCGKVSAVFREFASQADDSIVGGSNRGSEGYLSTRFTFRVADVEFVMTVEAKRDQPEQAGRQHFWEG